MVSTLDTYLGVWGSKPAPALPLACHISALLAGFREPNWMAASVKPKKKGIDVMVDGSWLSANKSGSMVGTLFPGSVAFEACPGYSLTVRSTPTTNADNV